MRHLLARLACFFIGHHWQVNYDFPANRFVTCSRCRAESP